VSNILVEPPEQPRHDQRAKTEKCYVDNVFVCRKKMFLLFACDNMVFSMVISSQKK